MDDHAHPSVTPNTLQRLARADLHDGQCGLRGILGHRFISSIGTRLEIARVLSVPHDDLRWRVPFCLHVHHSDWFRRILSVAALSASERSYAVDLFLAAHRCRSLCADLLDLDQGR